MRKFFKRVVSFFLIPMTRWYLRKERSYGYDGVKVKISPTVFHPGLFGSTQFLLSYLEEENISAQFFLELGCGSGLISVWAAKQNAYVTSCDLNPKAVETCCENARLNNVEIKIFQSDLFDSLPKILFDWIVINPPYYAKPASNEEELAWNCGAGFEYFKKLFSHLSNFIHPTSQVIMVLTQECDLLSIQRIAKENGFEFEKLKERNSLFDGKDFIFKIRLGKIAQRNTEFSR